MPALTDLRDQACIVGIGETDYTRGTPESALELALEASLGATHSRRDSDAIGLVVGAVTVVDTDGKAARDLARREAALYLPVIAELDRSLDIDPELLARIRAASDAYDFERAGSYISDDLLRRVAFAGTPEQVADQAAAVFEAGARRATAQAFFSTRRSTGATRASA